MVEITYKFCGHERSTFHAFRNRPKICTTIFDLFVISHLEIGIFAETQITYDAIDTNFYCILLAQSNWNLLHMHKNQKSNQSHIQRLNTFCSIDIFSHVFYSHKWKSFRKKHFSKLKHKQNEQQKMWTVYILREKYEKEFNFVFFLVNFNDVRSNTFRALGL